MCVAHTARGVSRGQAGASNDRSTEGGVETRGSETRRDGLME